MNRKGWVAVVIALVALAVVLFAAFRPRDSVQYFTEKVTRGDIGNVVQATGTINAVTTVQVGSQVSGTISALYADFNSHVKKGQVIARIDPSLFEGALLQAKADLQNAQANVAAAQANAAKAAATAQQAEDQYKRSQTLAQQGVTSEQQLELDRASAESDAADAKSMQALIGQAQAQVRLKQAAVTVAQTNLDHTIITAPVNGIVISRNVDVGQTVAASLQAPTLFQIAEDLTKMQVYTNIDESDVGQIRPGQPATFTVDAFPKETFRGSVDSIRLNATTVQNVVTYNTIIDFNNPQTKLFPGMTAYVSIPVATAHDVLRIPNGALHYKPGLTRPEIQQLYAAAGIPVWHGGNANGNLSANNQVAGGAQPMRASRGASQSAGNPVAQAMGGAARGGQNASRQDVNRQNADRQNASRQNANGPGASTGADAASEFFPTTSTSTRIVVWKLENGKKLVPVQVQTGITDHTTTAVVGVLHGTLEQGADLVTGSASRSASAGLSAPGGMGQIRRH